MKKWDIARFVIILGIIVVLYFTIIARLFYWQVVRFEELREIGRAQNSETIPIPAVRGRILANDGFPLASNIISYLLYVNPKTIKDRKSVSERLGQVLNDDSASIAAKLAQDLFWVKIAQSMSPDKKREIERLNIKGIGFQQEYSRFYPEASSAAHLIGFLGKDEKGKNRGYFGIEGKYDGLLGGRDGALYAIRDALGNQVLTDIREDKKIDGISVKLTIDRTIQYASDKRLAEGLVRYGATGGSVIIMEAKTGAILAMSSFPRFDPEKYYEYDGATYKNPALSSLYEPGSTFKLLIMAAALDLKRVEPDTRCNICSGAIQMGEYKIRTWNDKYFPDSTMTDVIVHSNNIGMVFVGQKLGLENMISYLKSFGLDDLTGIDLQGEAAGTVRDKKDWYPIDLATSSFGQGISTTPIQLITAVNSLANDGRLMTPYVVSEIQTSDGRKIEIKPKEKRRTVSTATSAVVTNMMVAAVEEGEAKWTKIKNYKIAGKTGTAQIPVSGHYDPNQTIASFVGFLPAGNPKVTMLVLVDRPTTSIYGSETAAPIFFNIARDIIKYYNLPPE